MSALARSFRNGTYVTIAILLTILFLGTPLWFQPHFFIYFFAVSGKALYYVKHTEGKGKGGKDLVALSLDDAPTNYTDDILQILAEKESHATFFVIGEHIREYENMIPWKIAECEKDITECEKGIKSGTSTSSADAKKLNKKLKNLREKLDNLRKNPDVLYRMILEGHELGNHAEADEASWIVAAWFGRLCGKGGSEKALYDQLIRTERLIDKAYEKAYRKCGIKRGRKLFRPGSGHYTDRVCNAARKAGLTIVLGNVYPHDPQISWKWLNALHMRRTVTRSGSIIINHDGREWTKDLLAENLEMLNEKYEVATIGTLLEKGEWPYDREKPCDLEKSAV